MWSPSIGKPPGNDGLWAACLTWVWIGVLHPQVFFAPHEMLGAGRDAVKNVFTLAWQIAYGQDFGFEFTGMAWPYGEHVFYTDGHPLLGWAIGWLSPDCVPPTLVAGGMLTLILISWGLAAAILVRVLSLWNVRGGWVIVLCSVLPLFHPQMLRWTGHYALAYTVAIPWTWYILVRWMQQPRLIFAAILTLSTTIWLLTHAYLGVICAAFTGIGGGLAWMQFYRVPQGRWPLWHVLAASLIPLGIYMVMLGLTDSHPFRTDQPYGYWDNVSTWSALWLPSHGPIGAWRAHWGLGLTVWEGWGYIGLGSMVALLAAFIARIKGQWLSLPIGLGAGLGAAIACAAVAVGEPFLTGQNAWLDSWPLFKQFRAIGRFVWPIGFVLPLFGAWFVSTRRSSIPKWLYAGFFVVEAFWMQQEARHQMVSSNNPFHMPSTTVMELQKVAIEHGAVALHPLPWFQMGSESVGRAGTVAGHREALAGSLHAGLPLTAAHLTRTSISESRNLTEWMSHPGLPRSWHPSEFGIPDTAVVLIWATDEQHTWAPDDRRLWRRATPTKDPKTRILHIDKWFAVDSAAVTDVMPVPQADDLAWNALDWILDSRAIEGSGTAQGNRYEYHVLDTLRPDSSWMIGPIEASCWFLHDTPYAGRDALQFHWVAEAEWPDGSREWIASQPVAMSGDHLNGWTRASVHFTLHDLPESLYLFTIGHGKLPGTVVADALRVQFAHSEIPMPATVPKGKP